MKALHVKDTPSSARVYSPTPDSREQSLGSYGLSVDQSQSPAVFARCGQGCLGYIGDVNNEEGSQALILVMIGILSCIHKAMFEGSPIGRNRRQRFKER